MLSTGSYNVFAGKSGWECGWERGEVPYGKRVQAAVSDTTLVVVSFTRWSR